MRIIKQGFWGSIILVFFVAAIAFNAYAQTPSPQQIIQDSGYSVTGEFLDYYRAIPEPLVVLGYPITDAFEDPVTHLQVQYFQRGRLELHPEAPAGQRVYLSDLGELSYTPGAPLADIPTSGPTCRYFPATGKSVCYAFMQYYDQHNGATYFGSPISQVEIREGRYVQYFEKTRMEWRPEQPEGYRVGLTDIGRLYYEYTQNHQPPPPSAPGSAAIGSTVRPTRLQVRAWVANSLAAADSDQTLYIVVLDEKLQPVQGAAIGVSVTMPGGGQPEFYRPPVTDQNGISTFTFKVGSAAAKQIVQLEVVATSLDLESQTNTWFRIWW